MLDSCVEFEIGMKVCVLGDSGVGKSTLVSAFLDQSGTVEFAPRRIR